MAKVNTYVHVRDEHGRITVLAPGDEVPEGVTVDNPDVLEEPQEQEQAPVPGPSQATAFDPESDEAQAKSEGTSDDGLDRLSHAELDDVAASESVSLSGNNTRAEKIATIRASRGSQEVKSEPAAPAI